MTATLKPANDAREVFAGDLYRLFSPVDEDFIISPSAIMKLLFVVSQGANENLADQILWDLALKHVDNNRLVEETKRLGITDLGVCMEMAAKLREELNRPIDQKALVEFLKNDFTELGDKLTIKNYLASSGKIAFKVEYQNFAKNYFNVTLLQKNLTTDLKSVDLRFSECFTNADLDIFGLVEFKFNFMPPFEMYDDGSFCAYGNFKFAVLEVTTGLDFRAEVVEIPLETVNNVKLTMLIFIPNELVVLLKRNIGRDYTDFNKIAEQLETKAVNIKLPEFNLQRKYELAQHFSEQAENGLRDCFSEGVKLNRMFEKSESTELYFGNYWQHTSLEMTAPTRSSVVGYQKQKSNDVIFDATDKSFFYVIKSEKVLYVMGHFYNEKLQQK